MIISKSKNLFKHPDLHDPAKIRIAQFLQVILPSIFIACILLSIIALVSNWPNTLNTILIVTFFVIIAYILFRTGRIQTASIILILFLTIGVNLAAYQGDGIHAISVIVIPVIILLASYFFNSRLFVLFSFLPVLLLGIITIIRISTQQYEKYGSDHLSEYLSLCLIFVIIAITVRKITNNQRRYMQEAKDSEAKFRHLFEDLPDAIFMTHTGRESGNIIDVNFAAERQTGYSKDELIGMNMVKDLLADRTEKELIDKQEKSLVNGDIVELTEKKKRKDGSEYWTQVMSTAIKYQNENVILSVNRDITKQREAEQQIRILSTSIEQSPALVMITDLSGKIEYVNSKFVSTTGYSLNEVKGKNPRILKSGETNPRIYKELWETILSGREWQGELQNRKKNGEPYWAFTHISSIKNVSGEMTHFLSVKEDITKQKELQQQLLQSQKMEAIGTLAGGIAHDFNNLLTVISGYSELALGKVKSDSEVYKYISEVQSAGEKAGLLTRQILAFSRKQAFQPIILDINQSIMNLEKMLTRLIGEDIRIEMRLTADIPSIKADPAQIEQILINLIVNARDAIKEKKDKDSEKQITIAVKTVDIDDSFVSNHLGSQKGKHVCIFVSDSGIGMSKENRSKIFEPFFTTKREGEGTGMGLSTIYGIVNQNNAYIDVDSEIDKGTTFKIYWPVTEDQLIVDHIEEINKHELLGSETILFVEDDKDVRDYGKEALKNYGYQVHIASNGKTALELVMKINDKIDLLITDLVMPEMDGKEFTNRFNEIFPDVPILITSGYTDNLFLEGRLEENMNFLAKPYTSATLIKKVREILDNKEK